jgi:hypothetical protein
VLVILRLCTSEEKVVNYWNNIDQQLELDIDVLDDQYGDAKQVRDAIGSSRVSYSTVRAPERSEVLFVLSNLAVSACVNCWRRWKSGFPDTAVLRHKTHRLSFTK